MRRSLFLFAIILFCVPFLARAASYCVDTTSGAQVFCTDTNQSPGTSCKTLTFECPNDTDCELFTASEKECADIDPADSNCCICGDDEKIDDIKTTIACKKECGDKPSKIVTGSCTEVTDSTSKKAGGAEAGAGATPKFIKIENPLGTTSIPVLLGRIINAALGIAGSIALLMFVYGGFLWVTSGGSTERITQGKNIVVWTTIGLGFIFASYALLSFIIRTITG